MSDSDIVKAGSMSRWSLALMLLQVGDLFNQCSADVEVILPMNLDRILLTMSRCRVLFSGSLWDQVKTTVAWRLIFTITLHDKQA